jgi:hypothetical protein
MDGGPAVVDVAAVDLASGAMPVTVLAVPSVCVIVAPSSASGSGFEGARATGRSIASHVPGMSAIGMSHVAVSVTP